jgi:hypothetical protein
MKKLIEWYRNKTWKVHSDTQMNKITFNHQFSANIHAILKLQQAEINVLKQRISKLEDGSV